MVRYKNQILSSAKERLAERKEVMRVNWMAT